MVILKYLARRILEAIPLMFGLVTVVFFLSRLLPGDATDVFISPTTPLSVKDQLRTQFGLDKPVLDQYFAWIGSVFSGEFGTSFTRSAPVLDVIESVFPNTVVLAVAALLFEVVLGICLALPTFFCEGKWIEKIISNFSLVVYTLPSFWIGVLLLIVFSYWLGMFPSSQMHSTDDSDTADLLHHLALPAATAAIPAAAGFARYLRSSISTIMSSDCVLTAKSMGLTESRVFLSYVLRNAITPLISLLGIEVGLLLTGVLVTETLFSWPGMGQLTISAILSRDYPLILGCTLVSGVVVIVGNLIADVVNAFIDPRIRLTE